MIRTAPNARTDCRRSRRREVPLVQPTDDQRQVVALRLFLDLDTETTAEIVGISPGTVKARLFRALAALREDLNLKEQIS